MATPASAPVRETDNIVLRLQHWPGAPMAREGLVAPPPGSEGNGLGFGYLGDIQLRLVFEQPGGDVAVVRAEDLARLVLTPPRAVALGLLNIKKRSGLPQVALLGDGVYALRARVQEHVPAYFLDRVFWREQLQKFPQGLVAAMPRPGTLFFAPADGAAEAELERVAARTLHAGGSVALSSRLYKFTATGWSVLRELPARPVPQQAAAADDDDAGVPAVIEQDDDLHKAASGQKILIWSILLGFGVNGLHKSQVHPLAILAVVLVLSIWALWGVVKLSSGLRKSTGATIAFMVMSFFPLLNIASWIVLSVQATRRLRADGWKVGLLGARP